MRKLFRKLEGWGVGPTVSIFIGALIVAYATGRQDCVSLARGGAAIVALGGIWAAMCNHRVHDYMTNYLSGGDSFCYIMPVLDQKNPHAGYALIHVGKYPLYDINLIFWDLEEIDIKNSRGDSSWTDWDQQQIGTLAPKQVLRCKDELYFPEEAEVRRYNINFMARNGSWVQHLRVRKINGMRLWAIRVMGLDETRKDKILYENICNEFPRNEQGKVEW